MSQHRVDSQQQEAGQPAGADGTPHYVAILADPSRPYVQGDDNAKGQRRYGVHGLIALQKALYHRM